ncbi:hypothetical protein CVT24_000112 [Panaeolus cyanescens]|uniref:Uncharacterized protein n=1 Tax=Panaeolus cyanescens TaxID=181874 RepID=A0A409W7K3_9AGAR|nr:hypothetical protein CVT24_000112 [Panaeolus cyanescens]
MYITRVVLLPYTTLPLSHFPLYSLHAQERPDMNHLFPEFKLIPSHDPSNRYYELHIHYSPFYNKTYDPVLIHIMEDHVESNFTNYASTRYIIDSIKLTLAYSIRPSPSRTVAVTAEDPQIKIQKELEEDDIVLKVMYRQPYTSFIQRLIQIIFKHMPILQLTTHALSIEYTNTNANFRRPYDSFDGIAMGIAAGLTSISQRVFACQVRTLIVTFNFHDIHNSVIMPFIKNILVLMQNRLNFPCLRSLTVTCTVNDFIPTPENCFTTTDFNPYLEQVRSARPNCTVEGEKRLADSVKYILMDVINNR